MLFPYGEYSVLSDCEDVPIPLKTIVQTPQNSCFPALLPATIGPYRLEKEIGRGGYGVVFTAWDKHLQRLVALKWMLPNIAGDKRNRARFLREARSLAAIQSKYVVPIYRVGEDMGSPYFVMPLLQGYDLDQLLKRVKKLPTRLAIQLARQLLKGLVTAHAIGLIHRDIKPSNIFLERDHENRYCVKLLDFGLARLAANRFSSMSNTMGTLLWMSPEQHMNAKLTDRSDIFSVGLVLFLLLTGKHAFSGECMLDLAWTVVKNDHPKLKTIPAGVSDLLDSMLAKNPESRPSALEAAATLKKLIADITN